jgi:hypothetical protein
MRSSRTIDLSGLEMHLELKRVVARPKAMIVVAESQQALLIT